jgi:hypothetical protein
MEQQQSPQIVGLPERIIAPMTRYSQNRRGLANLQRNGRAKGAKNRLTEQISGIARQYGPEALACIVTVMRKAMSHPDGIDANVVIRCADLLLTRGYGTPPASMALTGADGGPIDFRSFDDDRLDQFITRLETAATIEGEVVSSSEGREGAPTADALRPPATG